MPTFQSNWNKLATIHGIDCTGKLRRFIELEHSGRLKESDVLESNTTVGNSVRDLVEARMLRDDTFEVMEIGLYEEMTVRQYIKEGGCVYPDAFAEL